MIVTLFHKVASQLNNNRFNILILIIIATITHLPLYHTPYWRTDDAIQYINVARNLAAGKGFIQNTKADYATSDPVITSSFHGRTSLFSLFLAGILFIGGNEYTMQLFCFSISIINSCLIYILCRRWVSPKWSLVAGLLAALNPNLLINNRLILTEPLFTTFILLSFITIYFMKENYAKYCVTGVLISFAYLTRAEGIFLLPLFIITSIKSPKRIIKTVLIIFCFSIVSAPYWYGNYINYGNPFYSIHKRLYAVRDYNEYVNGNGYGVTFPTPLNFISNNFSWVVNKEILVFRDNINSLINFDFFGPFAIFLLLVFAATTWKKFANFYLYAFIIVLVYTSAWSALFERSRHFTATFLLLLIPLAYSLEKLAKKSKRVAVIVLVCVLIPYLVLDIHRIIFARTIDTLPADRWGPIIRNKEFSWIEKNTKKSDIISSTNPEMIYLFTDRAGIITPNALNKNNYYSYIKQYHVKYFFVDNSKLDVFMPSVSNFRATFLSGEIYEVRNN